MAVWTVGHSSWQGKLQLGNFRLGTSSTLPYPSDLRLSSEVVRRRRRRMKRKVMGALMYGLIISVTGCSHYYRVGDPGTGRTYYTKQIHDEGEGAVKFKDERMDSIVRLQSAEVATISEETYEAAVTLWPHIVIQPSVVRQP